jgi:hypothetical protein
MRNQANIANAVTYVSSARFVAALILCLELDLRTDCPRICAPADQEPLASSFKINLRSVLRSVNKACAGNCHAVLRSGKKMLRVVNFDFSEQSAG